MRLPAAMFGILPATTGVDIRSTDLRIRFGPWSLTTPLTNVLEADVTGPYSWIKVAGPPHLSRADTGVTFATSTREGVCIRFVDPVPAALPFGLMRHEGVTVTVAGPERFVRELTAAVERARHSPRSGPAPS
jgi:hypothetical protein